MGIGFFIGCISPEEQVAAQEDEQTGQQWKAKFAKANNDFTLVGVLIRRQTHGSKKKRS